MEIPFFGEGDNSNRTFESSALLSDEPKRLEHRDRSRRLDTEILEHLPFCEQAKGVKPWGSMDKGSQMKIHTLH